MRMYRELEQGVPNLTNIPTIGESEKDNRNKDIIFPNIYYNKKTHFSARLHAFLYLFKKRGETQ